MVGRREYGGLKTEQVKRLKELETENTRLDRAISDLTADKLILPRATRENFQAPPVATPVSTGSERICMSPSAALVRRSGSTARCSARRRGAKTMKSGSLPTSSSLPGNTAVTAIARPPGCWSGRAKSSMTGRSTGSGGMRGRRSPTNGGLWLADGSCIRLREAPQLLMSAPVATIDIGKTLFEKVFSREGRSNSAQVFVQNLSVDVSLVFWLRVLLVA